MPSSEPGPLALVGSGEYTAAMHDTDLRLLQAVGGPGAVRVVVLPTAAGLEEPSSPQRWARMGLEHFAGLGTPVDAAMILNRNDAFDPRWLPLLEAAGFFYFSGGNPHHVVETMADSPAWEVIRRRHEQGAVLAGCSAGAMAFSGWTPALRSIRSGGPLAFETALGLVPGIIVLPHFDRMWRYIPQAARGKLLQRAPAAAVPVGLDEDTALLRLPGAPNETRWLVSGRQTVTVFNPPERGGQKVYRAGDEVLLEA